MSKRLGCRILSLLLCTLASASIARAQEVSIMFRARAGNGLELQPGTYRVEVVKDQAFAEVRFYREGILVLIAPAKSIKENCKIRHSEVQYKEVDGAQVITLIRLQGSKEALAFNHYSPKGE